MVPKEGISPPDPYDLFIHPLLYPSLTSDSWTPGPGTTSVLKEGRDGQRSWSSAIHRLFIHCPNQLGKTIRLKMVLISSIPKILAGLSRPPGTDNLRTKLPPVWRLPGPQCSQEYNVRNSHLSHKAPGAIPPPNPEPPPKLVNSHLFCPHSLWLQSPFHGPGFRSHPASSDWYFRHAPWLSQASFTSENSEFNL